MTTMLELAYAIKPFFELKSNALYTVFILHAIDIGYI